MKRGLITGRGGLGVGKLVGMAEPRPILLTLPEGYLLISRGNTSKFTWKVQILILSGVVLALVILFECFLGQSIKVRTTRDAQSVPELGAVIAAFALPREEITYVDSRIPPYIYIVVTGHADPQAIQAYCSGHLNPWPWPTLGLDMPKSQEDGKRWRREDIAMLTNGELRIQCDFGTDDWRAYGGIGRFSVELYYRTDNHVFTLVGKSR